MTQPTAILLPGLDGTGLVFERFVAAAPVSLELRIQSLPADRPRGYEELVEEIAPRLPSGPVALIAESFSGPLAILLTKRCSQVCALVLCASFVRAPLPEVLSRVPEALWRRPPPELVLRLLMTGGDRGLATAVRAAVSQVSGAVLHARARAVLRVDVSDELRSLKQPVLVLSAARDRLLPRRCVADISAVRPSARVVTLDGPHLILQARPKESWGVIAPFLDGAMERFSTGRAR